MKRFLIASAVIAVVFVSLWVDVIPVYCVVCKGLAFRTDIITVMLGGYGDVMHQVCGDPPVPDSPSPNAPFVDADVENGEQPSTSSKNPG